MLPTKSPTKKPNDVIRLADAMRQLRAGHGCATEAQLIRLGFTKDQIYKHGQAAIDLANRLDISHGLDPVPQADTRAAAAQRRTLATMDA